MVLSAQVRFSLCRLTSVSLANCDFFVGAQNRLRRLLVVDFGLTSGFLHQTLVKSALDKTEA